MRAALACLLATACFAPDYERCAVECATECPTGLRCGADHYCHRDGDPATCGPGADATPPPPDATATDAGPAPDALDCLLPLPPGCMAGGTQTCNGRCYAFCTDPEIDWVSSENACRGWVPSAFADLITINDLTENDCLLGLAQGRVTWIGYSQSESAPEPDGGWMWVSGETPSFLNWATGEPNDTGLIEDCAIWNPGVATWNDTDCASGRAWVCELP